MGPRRDLLAHVPQSLSPRVVGPPWAVAGTQSSQTHRGRRGEGHGGGAQSQGRVWGRPLLRWKRGHCSCKRPLWVTQSISSSPRRIPCQPLRRKPRCSLGGLPSAGGLGTAAGTPPSGHIRPPPQSYQSPHQHLQLETVAQDETFLPLLGGRGTLGGWSTGLKSLEFNELV